MVGCREPATDDVRQLCEWHGRWQPKRTSHDDRPATTKQARRERYNRELLTPPSWAAKGACRAHPEVDFFPVNAEGEEAAVAVCQACPVRAQCAETGLQERFGVWGATTEWERVRLRAARRDSAA
jgi:WhiB family redox-sensing transcriptional regulator